MFMIGIDPGLSGAFAIVDEGKFFGVWDTPTVTIEGLHSSRREYDLARLRQTLEPFMKDDVKACIELVHAMPHQGVSSMFSMGKGLGQWFGMLAGLQIPFETVSPQRWKGVMMDGMGKEKDAARLKASRMFPKHAELLQRKKDDGRAEALLIAMYGWRLHCNPSLKKDIAIIRDKF